MAIGRKRTVTRMAKCLNCGEYFSELTVTQRYCCTKCGAQYRRKHTVAWPSISFDCAKCGRHVVTDGRRDMRTRFCSAACEKRYWRHPPYEHETSLINYHSAGEYLARERWENRKEAGL